MSAHVTFLNTIGGLGGAERVLLSMVKQLRQRRPDVRVSVVLLGHGCLEVLLPALGAEVHVLPLPESAAAMGDTQLRNPSRLRSRTASLATLLSLAPSMLGHVNSLRKLIWRLRPRLIHSNGLKAHALSAFAAPPNLPRIWHIHDFYSQRPVMARLLQRLPCKATRAVAISQAVQQDLRTILPNLPSRLIYNAVDTEEFCPGAAEGEELDRRAGLPPAQPGTLRVGLVATYANWKGHDVFLAAAARIDPAIPVRFYIVGGPIYATVGSQWSLMELQGLAERYGVRDRVGFVPFQWDLPRVYRSLDVMVHASIWPEPFGLTIVEAMSCGTATVVANAGGAAEIMEDGVTALGHTPGDAEALGRAIQQLLVDPTLRARIGQTARQMVLTRFSMDRFGREVADLYEEYLPSPRHGSASKIGQTAALLKTIQPSPCERRLPKRVAFLNPIGGIGGAEQSLLTLLGVLHTNAPHIDCSLLVGTPGPLLEKARALGVVVEQFPLLSLERIGDSGFANRDYSRWPYRFVFQLPRAVVDLARLTWRLRRWFAEHQPELIHSNGVKMHLLAALARPTGTPVIWHIRDFLGHRPLMKASLRWLSRRVALALTNSQAVAYDTHRVCVGLPLLCLYNLVDIDLFQPGQGDGAMLDRLGGVASAPAGTVRIGMVATYANWKGHDVLLKAFALLPQSPPSRLYLIGEPIYTTPGSQFSRAELEQLARELDILSQVVFVPFQNDTVSIYRSLDIVVHASTRPEPFGLTIAEAMACGRPIIISHAGGATELYTPGLDGLKHRPGDVNSLAEALRTLVMDAELRERLGKAARATAVQLYNRAAFAERLLTIYSTLVGPDGLR